MSDARDILGLDSSSSQKPTKKTRKISDTSFKKPGGMHRELYALLQSDYSRDPPMLQPTDTTCYKQPKAKIGRSRVRPWAWMAFTNPARSDGLKLCHWRRKADEGKEYPFAQFGKMKHDVIYSDEEYEMYLKDETGNWSQEETNYLFELSRQFDQRFVVMTDRYDNDKYPNRVMEDIKLRYYDVVRKLLIARTPPGQETQDLPPVYDAEHEKMRKEQLIKLFNRTPEEVEEEEVLVQQLKKIESRKKEREKKSHDFNKLITAAENKPSSLSLLGSSDGSGFSSHHTTADGHIIKKEKKLKTKNKKRRAESNTTSSASSATSTTNTETSHKTTSNKEQQSAAIRFPEIKGSGVFLRSSKLKMPPSVGNKKTKAVEQLLEELGVDVIPMPTEDICQNFNELRNQLLLLYELKQALASSEYDLQTLKMRYELMCPGKSASDLVGFSIDLPESSAAEETSVGSGQSSSQLLIDTVAPLSAIGSRKRRTAAVMLENNSWKKSRK